jgi:hypothetical protein
MKKNVELFLATICSLLLFTETNGQSKMHITEQLVNGTIIIENQDIKGGISTGTGFFYSFTFQSGSDTSSVLSIVTNKHVVENATKLVLLFKEKDSKTGLPKDGAPLPFSVVDVPSFIVNHPSKDVDLCVILIQPILSILEKNNKTPYIISLSEKEIPSKTVLDDLLPIEEVLMIGYPSGLFDQQNILPIVRTGITATSPSKNFNGKKEFLVDIAAFPGSSGSPVFILNQNGHSDKAGNIFFGLRFLFLGILYAGPTAQIQGDVLDIKMVAPTEKAVISRIPMNLGLVIRSEELLILKSEVYKKVFNLK